MPITEFRVMEHVFSPLLIVSDGAIDIMTMWSLVPP